MARLPTGAGKGGKSFQDRQLAAEVRSLALEEIKSALQGEGLGSDEEFRKAVLLKLSSTILPRLNEHSGPDGEPIPLLNVLRDNSGKKDSRPE